MRRPNLRGRVAQTRHSIVSVLRTADGSGTADTKGWPTPTASLWKVCTVGFDESMSICRKGLRGEVAVVGMGVNVLSRIDIMNSSGVPASTFVVTCRRKLSVVPGSNDWMKTLAGVASVMTTADDKSPYAMPKVRGGP